MTLARLTHISHIDALVMSLKDAKIMSLIDLEAGFWQVPVDEESAKLLTFSTPWGRFEYRRLPFGISIAPEIFHKAVVDALAGIPGVEVFVDDIFIHAPDMAEHQSRVDQVWERLKKEGFTPNKEKCQIAQTRIRFLGHIIGEGLVAPDPDKIQAILDAADPTSRKDLKSFTGALSWMRKHIPNLNDLLDPFRPLMKERTPWTWGPQERAQMTKIKTAVTKMLPLMMIRPGEQMILGCDASSYGLGACLTQLNEEKEERPVFFASRMMTDAEIKWAQIDKELLAIAWALERLDNFVYGQKIRVRTDHKPLLGLIKKPMANMSTRQQRLVARLLRYDFELEFIPGKELVVPDFLSRATTKEEPTCRCKFMGTEVPLVDTYVSAISTSCLSRELGDLVIASAANEGEYQATLGAYDGGWQTNKKNECGKYWPHRENIVREGELLLYQGQLVIPVGARKRILTSLHRGHAKQETMRKRAVDKVWWPGLSKDIKDYAAHCQTCQTLTPAQQREPMISFEIPPGPGLVWHSDFFEWQAKEYVFYVDAFSNWVEVYRAKTRSPSDLIKVTRLHFMRQGIPRQVHADQGSTYTAKEFREFCETWHVHLTWGSPKHPRGNAIAEAMVKKIKHLLKGANTEDEFTAAFLAMNQTPMALGRPTPAQLHFGRNLRDELNEKVEQAHVDWDQVRQWKEAKKEGEKRKYDQTARELPSMEAGQRVRVKWGDEWRDAVVLKKCHERPRSYQLKMAGTGKVVERNRVLIRPVVGKYEDISQRKKISPSLLFQQEAPEGRVTRRVRYLHLYTDDDPGMERTTNSGNRTRPPEPPPASPPRPPPVIPAMPPAVISSEEPGPSTSKKPIPQKKKQPAKTKATTKEGPLEDRTSRSGRTVKDPDRLIYHM